MHGSQTAPGIGGMILQVRGMVPDIGMTVHPQRECAISKLMHPKLDVRHVMHTITEKIGVVVGIVVQALAQAHPEDDAELPFQLTNMSTK